MTQGRPNADQWVEKYQVSYSLDGREWTFVDDGKIFQGNNDRNTWVRNNFETPIRARAIRIHPLQWKTHMSMRFDGIF